jgi:hypothetical protein
MRDPEQAAHALGKLLKYAGENNVLWGTDSIWYGSPQDQIQAFRTFQIAAELRAKHGYPEITPALRAKDFRTERAKVYSLSADGSQEVHAARRDCARAGCIPRKRAAALSDVRTENAQAVPEPARLERRRARTLSKNIPADRSAKSAEPRSLRACHKVPSFSGDLW